MSEEMIDVRKLSDEALAAWAEYDPPEFKHASSAIRDAFFAGWFAALRSRATIKEKPDVIQGNPAASDDLDEIEPVYQGLRTYAQNRRLLVLSVADLRRAARECIAALRAQAQSSTGGEE